jgi:hypothetical protein
VVVVDQREIGGGTGEIQGEGVVRAAALAAKSNSTEEEPTTASSSSQLAAAAMIDGSSAGPLSMAVADGKKLKERTVVAGHKRKKDCFCLLLLD